MSLDSVARRYQTVWDDFVVQSHMTYHHEHELDSVNASADCELVALKNKIDFKWNTKFPINSLYLMRGYIAIKDHNKKEFLDSCFEA